MKVYRDNIYFEIVCELCRIEGASLRELARKVGIAHSNMARHLEVFNWKWSCWFGSLNILLL